MKNKELIERLKEYNLEADVTLPTSEDITIGYIFKGPNGESLNKQTTMQLFIEGTDNCPECVHEYMNGDSRWCCFYDKCCKDVDECYQFEEFDEYG